MAVIVGRWQRIVRRLRDKKIVCRWMSRPGASRDYSVLKGLLLLVQTAEERKEAQERKEHKQQAKDDEAQRQLSAGFVEGLRNGEVASTEVAAEDSTPSRRTVGTFHTKTCQASACALPRQTIATAMPTMPRAVHNCMIAP